MSPGQRSIDYIMDALMEVERGEVLCGDCQHPMADHHSNYKVMDCRVADCKCHWEASQKTPRYVLLIPPRKEQAVGGVVTSVAFPIYTNPPILIKR